MQHVLLQQLQKNLILTISTLRASLQGTLLPNDNIHMMQHAVQAVGLVLACLSYDFVGTSSDDSSEDLGTIQVCSHQASFATTVEGHTNNCTCNLKAVQLCTAIRRLTQVPSPWRSQVEDLSNLQLLFDFYSSTSPPLSSTALECLVSTPQNLDAANVFSAAAVGLPIVLPLVCFHADL